MSNINDRTAVELAAGIQTGEITVLDGVNAVLEQIEAQEALLQCYVTIDRERVLTRAAQVQEAIDRGSLKGLLAGVPVAVKDNICTKDLRTTCASRMLADFVPAYSAHAVHKLEEAGAIIIGKTNMDEFAMGSTTETSAFQITKNPWNPAYVPGGSSGGSAAAVAARECFFALGSDTGGSIRQPAAFCGVVGMKPTYGRVSRSGLVAYASSLEQIGPLCKDVTDCAAVMECIAGYDNKDSTSIKQQDTHSFTEILTKDAAETITGLRIGIPREYLADGIQEEVRSNVLAAAGLLAEKGALVEQFELGLTEYAIPAYYTIASAEASSNLERFDGVKYGYRADDYEGLHDMYKKTRTKGFGSEVKRRILLGAFVLSAGYYDEYYLQVLKVRAVIRETFKKAFAKYDIVLGPVAPTTAPRIGSSLKDPVRMYLGDIYTVPANLAGFPAISLPCGMDEKGLPIGLQLTGNYFEEKKILQTAYAYEQARGKFERFR